jgi:hypothetical protein
MKSEKKKCPTCFKTINFRLLKRTQAKHTRHFRKNLSAFENAPPNSKMRKNIFFDIIVYYMKCHHFYDAETSFQEIVEDKVHEFDSRGLLNKHHNTEKFHKQFASLYQKKVNLNLSHMKRNKAIIIQKHFRGVLLRKYHGVHNPHCEFGKKFILRMFEITSNHMGRQQTIM